MSESETRLPARTGSKRLPLRLSIAERTFLLAHIGGASLTDAYLVVRPGVPRETAGTLGPRMFRRIQRKADWPKVLDGAGLGDMRLLQELEQRLNATIVRHYEGREIGTYPDNAVRMKATELLAELNGRRGPAEINIHTHDDGIRIYLPDNGRGDRQVLQGAEGSERFGLEVDTR